MQSLALVNRDVEAFVARRRAFLVLRGFGGTLDIGRDE
jgi:hypothetical protein